MSESEQRVSPVDMRLRVLCAALQPAMVLARVMSLSLDDVQAIVATSYFRELRGRGLSLRAIARRLGKSLRTVATLSKRTAQAPIPFALGQRIEWRRELAWKLARRGALPREKLCRTLADCSAQQASKEIDQLIDEGIISERGGMLALSVDYLNLIAADADSRIASLQHFLDVITQVIYRRFFDVPGDAEAFARVLSFSAPGQGLIELRQRSYEQMREAVIALDDPAGHPSAIAVCFVESPTEFPWTARARSHGDEE